MTDAVQQAIMPLLAIVYKDKPSSLPTAQFGDVAGFLALPESEKLRRATDSCSILFQLVAKERSAGVRKGRFSTIWGQTHGYFAKKVGSGGMERELFATMEKLLPATAPATAVAVPPAPLIPPGAGLAPVRPVVRPGEIPQSRPATPTMEPRPAASVPTPPRPTATPPKPLVPPVMSPVTVSAFAAPVRPTDPRKRPAPASEAPIQPKLETRPIPTRPTQPVGQKPVSPASRRDRSRSRSRSRSPRRDTDRNRGPADPRRQAVAATQERFVSGHLGQQSGRPETPPRDQHRQGQSRNRTQSGGGQQTAQGASSTTFFRKFFKTPEANAPIDPKPPSPSSHSRQPVDRMPDSYLAVPPPDQVSAFGTVLSPLEQAIQQPSLPAGSLGEVFWKLAVVPRDGYEGQKGMNWEARQQVGTEAEKNWADGKRRVTTVGFEI